MVKRKCSACAKAVRKDFNYCPYCGLSFKARRERENFGMLGRDDSSNVSPFGDEVRMPFGLGKIVDSLAKQLEKQMGNIDFSTLMGGQESGNGFKIKISTSEPMVNQDVEEKVLQKEISKEERARRVSLPKVHANSRIRRLSDRIVYEMEVPGVYSIDNVEVNELESGFEFRAYSKNQCFVKFIQLKSDIKNYYVEGGKLFVEMKA